MRRIPLALLLAGTLLLLAVTPFFGSLPLSPLSLGRDATARFLFWNLRVPRTILAFGAGALLSMMGLLFQSLFRNPLTSPFTLGLSSAASFGVFLSLKSGLLPSLPFLAADFNPFSFLFALLPLLLIYLFSFRQGDLDLSNVLLAGVAFNFLFSSLVLVLHFIVSPEQSFEFFKWIFGSLETGGYAPACTVFVLALLTLSLLLRFHRELDLFSLSEEIALIKGVSTSRLKNLFLLTASVVTAILVSYTGPIGFLDLVVPHIARRSFPQRHKVLLPLSAVMGGALLVLSDTLSRSVVAPAEIPVGILTTLFGVPFLVVVLLKKK